MKQDNRSLLLHVFLFLLINLIVQGALAIMGLDRSILPALQLDWIVARIIDGWIATYIPAVMTGVILSVSVLSSPVRESGKAVFRSDILGTLFFYSLVLIVLTGFVQDPVVHAQERIVRISSAHHQLMDNIDEARKEGRTTDALVLARRLAMLVPQDADAEAQLDALVREQDKSPDMPTGSSKDNNPPKSADFFRHEDLLRKAAQYADQNDFFTALHFLNIAGRQEKDDAYRALEVRIRGNLERMSLSTKEERDSQLFKLKEKVVKEYEPKGMWLEAYRTLLQIEDLATGIPSVAPGLVDDPAGNLLPGGGTYADPDVRNLMPVVHAQLMETGFPDGEVDPAGNMDQRDGLMIRVPSSAPGRDRFLYLESIWPLSVSGAYGTRAPELIELDADGHVLSHWSAAKGRIGASKLYLRSLDMDAATVVSSAHLLAGTMDPNTMDVIDLGIVGDSMYVLAGIRESAGPEGLAGKTGAYLSGDIATAGIDTQTMELSFLDRAVSAVSSMGFIVLSWYLGRRNRSRYLTPPLLLVALFLPVIYCSSALFHDVLMSSIGVLDHVILSGMGFPLAMSVALSVQGVLLLFVLFLFAGAANRSE